MKPGQYEDRKTADVKAGDETPWYRVEEVREAPAEGGFPTWRVLHFGVEDGVEGEGVIVVDDPDEIVPIRILDTPQDAA